jgi:hypothetical protein
LEEGVRDEVLALWHTQGLPAGKTHADIFGLTPHENIGPDLKYVSSYFGRVFDLSASEYRQAFNATQNRFPEDWSQTVRRLEDRDHIVCIWASRGFFQALGVGDWPTLEHALIGVAAEPEKVLEKMELYGEFCAAMLDRTMKDVSPEFIYLSEPISDTKRPLISPEMFEKYMIPVYRRLVEAAKANGCENILLSTYGNTTRLFPMLIEAGITMLWISEAPEVPELDYFTLREKYGPEIGLIGGIPLSLLRNESPATIRDSLEEIVPPLLQTGRYIPLAGGRVREEIPWTTYKHYREVLKDLLG